MRLRNCFVFSNYLLAALGVACLALGGIFSAPVSYLVFSLLAICLALEHRKLIPRVSNSPVSLWQIGVLIVPILYFLFKPPLLNLVAGFLVVILISRFIFKTELNDYLYNYLISIVCLLLGALYIRDISFGPVFLAFYLMLCWSLMFYNMMVERVGSRCPPDGFRATGEHETVGAALFGLSASMIVASLVLTAAIFISFPRLGLGFMSLGTTGQPISGFSNRVKLGEVGLIKQNSSVVMRVEFKRNGKSYRPRSKILWRGVTLDHYDGSAWSSTLPTVWTRHNRMGRGVKLFAMETPRNLVAQSVFMESFHSPVIFTYGLPLSISGSFKNLVMDQGFAFKTEDANFGPRRFNFVSDISRPEINFTQAVYIDTPELFPDRFLQLPRTSQRMTDLAARFSGAGDSPEVIARKILRYLATDFGYTLNMERQGGMSAIDEFLFVRKEGHCEYFASAMVLLLRQNSIPARLVNGFMGVEWNDLADYMIVRQSHAHSWVEAYLPGRGWRVFDPTPPDPMALSSSSQLERSLDLLRLYWQRYVMKYSLEDQVALVNFFNQGTRQFTRQLKAMPSLTLEKLIDAIQQHPVWGGVIAGLALTVFALMSYWIRGGRAASRITFAVHMYQTMLRRLEKKGVRKPRASTPMEFLDRLGSLSAEEQQTVLEITRLYEKNRFGNLSYSTAEKQHLRHLVRQL